MVVPTEHSAEAQYSPVQLKQARLVSCLLYGTQFLIVKCTSGGLHLKGFRHDVFLMTRATRTKASYCDLKNEFTECEIICNSLNKT